MNLIKIEIKFLTSIPKIIQKIKNINDDKESNQNKSF